MDQSSVAYAAYVDHARRTSAARQRRSAGRLERAWQHARKVAEFLRRNYAPTRIVAFGSLVHPEIFSESSDIDIAVEGIPWPDFLRAWNAVEPLSHEFRVDLVDLTTVSDLMRRRIDEEGRTV